MDRTTKKRTTRDLLAKHGLGGLVLAVVLSSPSAFAQQTQPDQNSSAPQAQQQQQAPPPDQNGNPPQAQDQQPAQQPDQAAPPDQNMQQDQNAPPQDQQNQQDQGPMNLPPPDNRNQNNGNRVPPPLVPSNLTLPAGSVIQIRTTEFLSSDKNQKGNTFIATLAQPIVIDGWVVMRRGQTITGQVTDAVRAGRVKGVSKLQLELNQLTLVDGQLVPVQTQLLNASAGTSNGRDAAAIGLTTGTGAAIGAAAGGGPGAAIGAGAGFVASVAGVLLTRGKPTIIVPETLLTFKTEQPVSFSTVRGLLAFRPVSQSDYAPAPQRRNANYRRAYPYPAPYPYYYGPGYYPPPGFYYGPGFRYGW
ncbi:MAG TPA: hypothetical protein VIH97_11515 [Candidatus Acidoferrales bacterium]